MTRSFTADLKAVQVCVLLLILNGAFIEMTAKKNNNVKRFNTWFDLLEKMRKTS